MNCFNGEKYLPEAIDSVIAQSYENWEIVFWDNQSTDRSAEIFKSYTDPRLKYFYAPKHTLLYEARNSAMERARGEFLAFLDVDDWWTPDKLEKQVPLFSDPEVGIVCGNYWVESERKNKRWVALKSPPPTGGVTAALLKSNFVGLATLVIRRAALDSLEYRCNPRYHIMGDYDLVLRLSLGWKLGCVNEPVAHYRLHAGNETMKHRNLLIDEMEHWLEEAGRDERFARSPGFPFIRNQLLYLRGIYQALESRKREAFRAMLAMSRSKLKLRLVAALVLPGFVLRRLPN
jgi:glycosyltransferase involved in cell wall biosynthesis